MNKIVRSIAFALSLTAVPLLHATVNPDGSFGHSIPVEIPAGRNGLQPQLALSYNSNSPNGVVGIGWSLQGLPAITRLNYGNGINYGRPGYAADTFTGPEGRLIELGSGTGIFHAETETWSKYEAMGICGNGPCSWKVTDRNGLQYFYGMTSNSRIVAKDAANNDINNGAIRVWALERVQDLNGNYYEISYKKDAGIFYDNGQYYPEKISYTLGNGVNKNYAISFFYDESGRPDKEISFAQSAYVKTNWRLSKIAVDHESSCLLLFTCNDRVRSYTLAYETSPNLLISRLNTVQEFNTDNLPLPVTEFKYSNATVDFSNWTQNFPAGENNGMYWHYLADVNGDGRADLIQIAKNSNNGWISIADQSGNFSIWTHSFPAGGNNGSYRHYFADVNGDGRTDLIQIATGSNNGWIALADQTGNFNIWTYGFPVGENNGMYRHYFADVNGDGRTDLIQIATGSNNGWIALADQNGNFNIWTYGFPVGENNGMYRHYFADLNGDGRPSNHESVPSRWK